MRTLITGAGGFIGSHLVDKCVRLGHYVIGLDKKSLDEWIKGKRFPHFCMPNVRVENLESYPVDFDLVFHLAAESRIQPSFKKPLKTVCSNVLGTAAVLTLAKCNGASVVYAGSSTADDIPEKNVYAMSKWQGEELCRTWRQCFGTKIGIARFYNVYGERHVSIGEYATVVGIFERQYVTNQELTVTGDGSQRRDFTHVNDIVDGLIAIAENGGNGEYRLGTGRNYSILEVAKMFVNEDRIVFLPKRRGESEETCAQLENTAKRLKWEAKVSLEDYVNNFKSIREEECIKIGVND